MTDGAPRPVGRPRKVTEYPTLGAHAQELRARARDLASAAPDKRREFFVAGERIAVTRAVAVLAESEGQEFFDQAERFMRLADAIGKGPNRALDSLVDEGKAHVLVKTVFYIESATGTALARAQDLWDKVAGPPTGHARQRAARPAKKRAEE